MNVNADCGLIRFNDKSCFPDRRFKEMKMYFIDLTRTKRVLTGDKAHVCCEHSTVMSFSNLNYINKKVFVSWCFNLYILINAISHTDKT